MELKTEFLMLDGGMGTTLQAMGLPPGGVPELLNLEKPEMIAAVHRAYVDAGAQVVYTNTFGAKVTGLLHYLTRTTIVTRPYPILLKTCRIED